MPRWPHGMMGWRRSISTRRAVFSPDVIVILCGVCAALHVGKLPPALPVLQDALGITLLQAGFLLSLVQLAGMTLGLAVGLSADGLGLRRGMITGLMILTGASASGGWARGASDLLWLRAMEGLGFLLVALPAPSLIRQLVEPAKLNLKLGLWGGYMPFGTALALLSGPWMLEALGWRAWWWGLAALSAAMALWMSLAVPSDTQRHRPDQSPAATTSPERWWQRLHQTLTAPGPWLVALIFALYSGQWLAVIGFLPSIYAQAGVDGRVGGALTAFAAACNVLGNLGAGRMMHRGVVAARLLQAGFVVMALGTFLAFGLTQAPPSLRYLGVLLFSGVGGMIPATLFMLGVRLAPNARTVSTTIGWVQQFAALGQFVGAPLVAWVAGAVGGWQWTWVVTGAACLLGLLLANALPGRPVSATRTD